MKEKLLSTLALKKQNYLRLKNQMIVSTNFREVNTKMVQIIIIIIIIYQRIKDLLKDQYKDQQNNSYLFQANLLDQEVNTYFFIAKQEVVEANLDLQVGNLEKYLASISFRRYEFFKIEK